MNRTLPLVLAATLLVAATLLATTPPAAATRSLLNVSPKEAVNEICGLNCARCGCQEVPRDKQQQAHLRAIAGDASALCLSCCWPVKPAAVWATPADSLTDKVNSKQGLGPPASTDKTQAAATTPAAVAAGTRGLLYKTPGPGERLVCGPNCAKCGCKGFPDVELEQRQKRAREGDAYAFCRDCCWLEKLNATDNGTGTGGAGGNKS